MCLSHKLTEHFTCNSNVINQCYSCSSESDLQVGVLPGGAAEVEPAPALLRLEAVHHRQHPGIGK